MIFGSKLYGTDTPDSDTDYKAIYLPSFSDVILGKIKKSIVENTKDGSASKNIATDIDVETYSLHYFIDLACQGQTVAIDMLHAPPNMIINTSPIWGFIVANREKFYTKNLNAFIGYAQKQASKYGVKGSRLAAAKELLNILKAQNKETRLEDFWDTLPVGEHIELLGKNTNGIFEYKICGRILQSRMTVEHAYNCVKKYYDDYGKRAKLAEKNEGVDWKAVSHACRAAIQVKQLLIEGTITFPLKEARFITEIKSGLCIYKSVALYLEDLITEVKELSEKSILPEKVDHDFWDNFLVGLYS
jgi:predicted nucleotidyltransferase